MNNPALAAPHPPDILVVSNGYGEAAIAGYIARALVGLEPAAHVEHLPLVGCLPADSWPPVVGPQRAMPSGGLVTNWNWWQLLRDVRSGLVGLTLAQIKFLRRQQQRDVLLAVGDIYCLAMCELFARRPTIFVATAKSEYVAGHSPLEHFFARRAWLTFARDEQTARALERAGVRARYAGNVMMDGMATSGADLELIPDALHIAVLPGSRADAAANAAATTLRLLALAQLLEPRQRKLQALFSVAPSIDEDSVRAAIQGAGVTLATRTGSALSATGSHLNLHVAIVRNAFADLVALADVVFGQAGTANEQAAGLGRPVVAAAEPGELPEKMRWYRMRQKRLLGDALLVLPAAPGEFAHHMIQLLDDPRRLALMSLAGKQRMGTSGGANAVAAATLALVTGAAA